MPDNPSFHHAATLFQLGLGVVTWLALLFVVAPYGRHGREGWGPTLPARRAWMLMESPAIWAFLAIYLAGSQRFQLVPLLFLVLWQLHYVHRSLIFPFRIRASARPMPLLVVMLAVFFNLLNAYVNARWISEFGHYETSWLTDLRFAFGVALFGTGMWINLDADARLRRLRQPGESEYRVPRGGLFEYVSCPNYFGEILEWVGWAILTWSLAGFAFAFYTLANLAPRAAAHHRWYRETFPDYPAQRRALLPFVW
jgi:steroid 5-alpha-reductase/3-oxo-5-alpha-steroid 4-dehydrogenase 1